MDKKLSFGKSVAEKHQELQKTELENIAESSEQKIINEISKIASTREEAMHIHNLKPITKSNKFELEEDHYAVFTFLAGKLKKDISELASEYVFEKFKTDYKKYQKQFNLPYLDLDKKK